MILNCTCTHRGQDKLHGRGMRVFTPCANNKARCTVCANMRDVKKS